MSLPKAGITSEAFTSNGVVVDGTEQKTLLSHGFHCHNFNFQTQEHFLRVHNLTTNSVNAWAASFPIPG
jgi:hypothetical protein